MGLGTQIRKYRKKAGWTLEQLSDASGVEIGTIHALETRDSSRSKYLPALAKALGLTIEQLADEQGDFDVVVHNKDGSTVFVQIKEPPSQPYLWPFKDIKPHQWDLLTDAEKEHVEQGVRIIIKAREDPKHQAPANYIASA